MHPENPWVPIIHMNVRYFELSNGEFWFGGGIDLTPHIIIPAQAKWFHEQLKAVCDRFDPIYYLKYKNWADDYFYSPHREETRGIGGIFFDYIKGDKETVFEFVKAVGESFEPIYSHLMRLNASKEYTQAEKDFQYIRRGRYVEFNLVHDRGTKFGLETNGRTESILMSLPPMAAWEYMYDPQVFPEGQKTFDLLKKGINWI
jgi:coproporphyrinogen III oxidase